MSARSHRDPAFRAAPPGHQRLVGSRSGHRLSAQRSLLFGRVLSACIFRKKPYSMFPENSMFPKVQPTHKEDIAALNAPSSCARNTSRLKMQVRTISNRKGSVGCPYPLDASGRPCIGLPGGSPGGDVSRIQGEISNTTSSISSARSRAQQASSAARSARAEEQRFEQMHSSYSQKAKTAENQERMMRDPAQEKKYAIQAGTFRQQASNARNSASAAGRRAATEEGNARSAEQDVRRLESKLSGLRSQLSTAQQEAQREQRKQQEERQKRDRKEQHERQQANIRKQGLSNPGFYNGMW